MEESPETSKEQEAAAGQAGGAAPVDPSGTEPPSAATAALSVDTEVKATGMEVDSDAAGQADSDPKPEEEESAQKEAPPAKPVAAPSTAQPEVPQPERRHLEAPENVALLVEIIEFIIKRQFGEQSGAINTVMWNERAWLCARASVLEQSDINDLLLVFSAARRDVQLEELWLGHPRLW